MPVVDIRVQHGESATGGASVPVGYSRVQQVEPVGR